MTDGEIMSNQMTKSKLSCKARWLAFTVACVVLPLAGCEGIFRNPPSNMPKLRFNIHGSSARECPNLNGTYQYQSAEGYQFVPRGYDMPNPEDARFASIQFKYNNGAIAQLFSTFGTNLATGADISGDKGRIRMTQRFHGPTTSLEYYPGAVDTREIIPFEKAHGGGYEYEAHHVTECMQKGLIESPVLTHADTLLLMETLDAIRAKAGIHYPVD